jgi:hypothetical protein
LSAASADQPLQPQPSSAALQQQLQALGSEAAALLCSLQVLLSGLACCSAGWAYLRAAGVGLEALARAISQDTQVIYDEFSGLLQLLSDCLFVGVLACCSAR